MNRLADMPPRSTHSVRFSHVSWAARGPASPALETSSSPPAAARAPALEEELASLRGQRESLQRALADAAQVQRRLSGPRLLRRGEFEIASENFAHYQVSGDLLTAFDVGQQTVLAIGDICGKGLFAGMWFTHLAGLIRVFAGSSPDAAHIAAGIHSHFIGLQPEPPMASLFLGCLDSERGEITYCNAGHPDPLLLRAGGQVERLITGGPLLGAVPEATFSNGRAVFAPGETLIGYSDGVVECRNGSGEDFPLERLAAAAGSAGGSSATAMLFSILGATQDFAATQPRADDVALLVVHRRARADSYAAG